MIYYVFALSVSITTNTQIYITDTVPEFYVNY